MSCLPPHKHDSYYATRVVGVVGFQVHTSPIEGPAHLHTSTDSSYAIVLLGLVGFPEHLFSENSVTAYTRAHSWRARARAYEVSVGFLSSNPLYRMPCPPDRVELLGFRAYPMDMPVLAARRHAR